MARGTRARAQRRRRTRSEVVSSANAKRDRTHRPTRGVCASTVERTRRDVCREPRPWCARARLRAIVSSDTSRRHVRQALPSRRRVVSRPETRRRRVSGSIASVIANPRPRRARLVPRRAASRPASTDLPRLVPIVARFASHRRRTTPSSPRRSRRSTRSARTCLSFSRTTSSSNGTSAWAKAGSAPPTEPSGEVRRPHARRPHTAFFCPSPEHEKTHTESHTRVSNVPSPLTKKPPERFRCASTGEEVCARVVDTTRVSCAVDEVATVDGTRARARTTRFRTRTPRLDDSRQQTKRGFGPPSDPTRLLFRFFFFSCYATAGK